MTTEVFLGGYYLRHNECYFDGVCCFNRKKLGRLFVDKAHILWSTDETPYQIERAKDTDTYSLSHQIT